VLINPAGKLEAVFRPRLSESSVPRVVMASMVSDFAKIVRLDDA